ncbi:hypothetical protein BGW41_007661, partial [Actinomortierella wolfii]
MKAFALLVTLATYANAAQYIIDVYHGSDKSITFFGTLRYLDDHWPPRYQNCVAKVGGWVKWGYPGGIS